MDDVVRETTVEPHTAVERQEVEKAVVESAPENQKQVQASADLLSNEIAQDIHVSMEERLEPILDEVKALRHTVAGIAAEVDSRASRHDLNDLCEGFGRHSEMAGRIHRELSERADDHHVAIADHHQRLQDVQQRVEKIETLPTPDPILPIATVFGSVREKLAKLNQEAVARYKKELG